MSEVSANNCSCPRSGLSLDSDFIFTDLAHSAHRSHSCCESIRVHINGDSYVAVSSFYQMAVVNVTCASSTGMFDNTEETAVHQPTMDPLTLYRRTAVKRFLLVIGDLSSQK